MTHSYHYIEFDDYSGEWLIPLRIAEKNGEDLPLFVCSYDNTSFTPGQWGEETSIHTEPWYAPLTERLQMVTTLCDGGYQVFRANDIDAYHLIWTRLNRNHRIAHSVFSADCDLPALESKLLTWNYYNSECFTSFASWGYGQRYGGGSDEHYAYFCAKNTGDIELFHTLLAGGYFAKWYEKLNCVEAFKDDCFVLNDVNAFLKGQIKQHVKSKCYVLYRNFRYSSASIETFEDFQQWRDYHGYDQETCPDDEYEERQEISATIRGWLDLLLSFPEVLSFDYHDHHFKVIEVDDFGMIETILSKYEFGDYVDGFFSIDAKVDQLKKQITEFRQYNPERLFNLGQWAVINQVDDVDFGRFILFSKNKADLSMQISKDQKYYTEHGVNTRAILK